MKRQRAKFDLPSRCCVSLCNRVINTSSVDMFGRYANCKLSMNGEVQALIFGRITFSKHLEFTAVSVTGRRSLSTFGSGFLLTGMISPIFHSKLIVHKSMDYLKVKWRMNSRLLRHFFRVRPLIRPDALLVLMDLSALTTSWVEMVKGPSFRMFWLV